MTGGIGVITFIPAALTAISMRSLVRLWRDDATTANATGIGAATGGLAGAVGSVGLVLSSGSGSGLSAASIASRLASLGGGSIAAGGGGMLAGLSVLTLGTMGVAALAGGASWGVAEGTLYLLEINLRNDIMRLQRQGVVFPDVM
mmetsp:Transcript_20138/g.57593  ORF Transcript_20138/g.57593 Transcript_20138/m.57593 type:complete len:145 (+) Transcript_20138:876-1310(+)